MNNAEKYIYCPSCATLSIHNRVTGDAVGWLCQECNPPLEDFGGESDGESE